MNKAVDAEYELSKYSSSDKVEFLPRFFKTGPGQYGEGDEFIGVVVPDQRIVAKKFVDLPLAEIQKLLKSKIHEHRLTALMILVYQYKKATDVQKDEIYKFYLSNTKLINNWDLVDLSARDIVGEYLVDRDRDILYRLARSSNLWEKRIAIVATWAFIRRDDHKDTLGIAELLLGDTHDLIHKAVGWMLREVGKRDRAVEEQFLKKHHKTMPRTALRYALEHFDDKKRKLYMAK